VEKAGAWYSVGSERIGQGKDNARDYLKQNIELSQTIEGQIRDKLMVNQNFQCLVVLNQWLF
jgi:recombination protein RecA